MIECTGTSNTLGTETTQVTLEAVEHGTFFDANDNRNGLISLADTNYTVDYLKENASGKVLKICQKIIQYGNLKTP